MKIFLTGISGFIGRHLAQRLLEIGHEVDAVAGSILEHERYPFVYFKNFRFVDSSELKRSRYGYVIHLAATTNISSGFNPDIFFNNILFAQAVLSTPFRTIYASSTSVYELNNPYAYSKAFNEHLGNLHGNALGLRLFNVYGPGNNKGIVKRVIDCCITGEPLTLKGGDQVRDFIYVDDVVDIIVEHLDNPLQVMDVGTGLGTKIYDLVKMVCHNYMQTIGKEGKPFRVEWEKSDYAGEQMVSIAQSNPEKEYTPLADGIRKTIEAALK